MGIGIIGDDQSEITPFQRQVYEAEKARQAKQQEERMERAQNGNASAGGSGRTRNASHRSSAGNTTQRTETVRYNSDSSIENDEANTAFVD